MTNLNIKRGDTFYAQARFCTVQGLVTSLAGVSISAKLFDARQNLAHTFNAQITDVAAGLYEFSAFDTTALPVAQYTLQITYTKNNVVLSAVRLGLNIVKLLTSAPQRHARLESISSLTKFLITDGALSAVEFEAIWTAAWDAEWA